MQTKTACPLALLALSALSALMCVSGGVSVAAQRGGGPPPGPPNPLEGQPAAIEEGRQIYNKACTVCHGLDGGAGEMGPALGLEGRRSALRGPSEIFDAIKNGIPATGMPPAPDLPDQDIWKVTAYIQALRGTAIDAPTPGNAAAGDAIFWGKAECGKCHMVRGKGGIIGPELSAIADLRKTASIADALTKSGTACRATAARSPASSSRRTTTEWCASHCPTAGSSAVC